MKMKRILMAAMASVALLFASCSNEMDLEKTQWSCSFDRDFTDLLFEEVEDPEDIAQIQALVDMMGGKFIMTVNTDLDFKTATEGTFTFSLNPRNLDKLPDMMQQRIKEVFEVTDEEPFTYTFSDNSGKLIFGGYDEEIDLSYDKSNKVLTMSSTDPGMAELFGTTSLNFKQK